MESSSNDSFLWSDASNSSVNMSSESNTAQFEEECEPDTYNNKKKDKKHNKSKRKKEPDCGEDCQPEKKRIKIEPESDIDKQKKKKLVNDEHENNYESYNCVLKDDDFHNVSVKKEQEYVITPELVKLKKKKKHKNSDIDKSYETQSIINPDNSNVEHYLHMMVKEEQASSVASEVVNSKKGHKYVKPDVESQPDLETSDNDFQNYLNFRVKQEQASVAEPDLRTKRKKKKKRKDSTGSTAENTSELKSVHHNDTALGSDTSSCNEKKISGKGKKKRIDKDVYDNLSKNKNEKIKVDFKEGNESNSDNDIIIEGNDFTCNNIVHSTIINNSTVDTTEETKNHVTDSIGTDISRINNEYQRGTKISDKIRFEDDDTRSYIELESNKKSSRIKEFLKTNPHLQIVSKIQNNGIITEDDDIWILKCPHGMNLKKLKHTYLSLEGKCNIKIDGQTYNGMANEDTTRLTVLTYQNGQARIKNLQLKGCVNYRKQIPKAHVPDNINIANDQTDVIPLPDTKCRHPLFGADYKKVMKIPAVVAERLEAAKERNVSCQGIHKKRKKNKIVETNVKIEDESNAELKKNKKRKQIHSEEKAVPSKKKKKYDRDNTEVWECEKAIEENLFNF